MRPMGPDTPSPLRLVLEHGLLTTHLCMTVEAQRIHRAGRSTRPNRSAGDLGLGKTPLGWWPWASPASDCDLDESPAYVPGLGVRLRRTKGASCAPAVDRCVAAFV